MIKKSLIKASSFAPRDDLGSVLVQLMDECDIDALQLEQQTGVPASTINRFRSSKNCNPTLSSLTPIADFFCINISQLIGEEPLDKNRVPGIHKVLHKNNQMIPILSWEQATDWPALKDKLAENNEQTKWLMADGYFSNLAFALMQQGDSMEPRFPVNSLLIFDPTHQAENRDFVLALLENQKRPIVRQLLIDGEDKYLKSLNPDFKEVKKVKDNDHQILGVVTQVRMDLKENEFA